MSAPNKVTSNGTLTLGLGTSLGVTEEKHTVSMVLTTVFTCEEFSFDPTTKETETLDSDEAIIMTKDTSPQALISMKGQTVLFASGSLMVQVPGTAITTTIGNGTAAIANFTNTINGFDPTAGIIKLRTVKHTQGRLSTSIKTDMTLRHLPHVVNA